MDFINLNADNIGKEHICCAFSDKKCAESYELKKTWLSSEFDNGYRFYRLNERAKVFIEYGPSEYAWLPVTADNFYNINCFWVSGKYKGQGYAKQLLAHAEKDALKNGRAGLVTVTGKKKFHFMSDGKWFLRQGFEIIDETNTGFILLVKMLSDTTEVPRFSSVAKEGLCPHKNGLTVYYSNRCPYAEYHVTTSLRKTAENLNLPLHEIKLASMEQAQAAPTPGTIFSLFKDGEFITTDLSICMETRFVKHFGKENLL